MEKQPFYKTIEFWMELLLAAGLIGSMYLTFFICILLEGV